MSQIASTLKLPSYADKCTENIERISYARVLVEMDVTIPLLESMKVQIPNERLYDQVVHYD